MSKSTSFKSTCFYAILISILLFLLEGFAVAFVLMLTNNQGLSYFLGYLITLLIIAYKYRDDLISDFKNLKKDTKGFIRKLILVYIGFILLMYLSNIVLYNIFGSVSSNESDFRNMLFSSPFFMSISCGILGPMVEELVFRFPYKNIKTNKLLKFFIYTFIFAFVHVISNLSFPGILYLVSYIFLSIAIGYSYFKTNNIYTSMIAHMFNNISTIILLLIFGG